MIERGRDWPPRELGVIEGFRPGPLLICVGGVHGNEPGGVDASERFLAKARAEGWRPARGRMVFLVGNRRALREGCRYVDVDLNRLWSNRPGEGLDPTAHELIEQRELRQAIEVHRSAGSWETVVLLDMHSTSGEGPPFAILGDTLSNRLLAEILPIPILLGLEERVDGTLLAEFGRRGERAICVEGGINGAEATVDALEAMLELVANQLGILPGTPERLEESHERLKEHAHGAPHWSRLSGLYAIDSDEQFTMQPGFQSFDRVQAGQLLAYGGPDGRSPILAPKDSLLIMPRYQGQGSDGFYLAGELPSWWRPVSRTLRRAGLRRLVPRLLGEGATLSEEGHLLTQRGPLSGARRRLLALLGYHVASTHAEGFDLRCRIDPVFDEVAEDSTLPGNSAVGGAS